MKAAELISALLSEDELWEPPITLSRNQFLVTPNDVERHAYFVTDGCLRAFYVSEHEEHTIRFGYINSIITSIPSYYTGESSLFYLQAIRKTTVRPISKKNLEAYIRVESERLEAYILLMQEIIEQQIEREIDLLTSSPLERLARVRKRSPHVFQEVPLKYIASYLRMTPETLSRILKS
jgi:CRP/FNR family transcriptional regulator, anaerobic regulatory protein